MKVVRVAIKLPPPLPYGWWIKVAKCISAYRLSNQENYILKLAEGFYDLQFSASKNVLLVKSGQLQNKHIKTLWLEVAILHLTASKLGIPSAVTVPAFIFDNANGKKSPASWKWPFLIYLGRVAKKLCWLNVAIYRFTWQKLQINCTLG